MSQVECPGSLVDHLGGFGGNRGGGTYRIGLLGGLEGADQALLLD